MPSDLHPTSCLSNCLATFGNMIVPRDRDFEQVCKVLSEQSQHYNFYWLYCCDLNNCGIEFGRSAGLFSDVKELINRCKRFGILNIVDPGPPQVSQCQTILASTAQPTTPVFSFTTTSSQRSGPTSLSTAPFIQPVMATPTSTASYTQTFSQPSTFTVSSAISPSTSNLILTDHSILPTETLNTPQASGSPPSASAPLLLSQTPWQKLTPAAKAGSISGLTLFLLLLILALLFLKRHKLRSRLLHSKSPSSSSTSSSSTGDRERGQSPRSSPTQNEVQGRGGGRTKGGYDVIVIETEGKNSVDSKGIRWPESVVLTGDAKQMRQWSLEYGREKERRSLGRERRSSPSTREGWRGCDMMIDELELKE